MAAAQTAPRRFGTKPKEICRDYARGRCWRGAECCYWHDDEQPVENVSNTSPAVEILSDKRFQPLKFSNEFSDSNNHPRSGDAGLERDDNPEDALDFTPEQLPRSVCWAWLRGGCSRGDACKYPHGNYRQPAATPQDRPMSCQHDFGETSKPTFRGSIDANSNERELALRPHKRCASLTITQFGARVTYGDGLAVNRVQIEHESCTRVVLSNIPTSISRTDFFAAVKLFGHVLDVDFKDDLSMKRDSMLAYVAYTHHARAVQAMSALDGSAMFGRVLSAQIPSGVSIGQGLIHDSTVVLSWDAPKLIGYAGYATQEEADNIIVATNDQELDGRIMKSYIHTGLPSLGVCTVRLENIPRQSVMTKRKFIGKTEGFMIEKPKYALHVAVREVRAFVERSIPQADLLAFDMDMSPDRHGIVRATITCSSAAAAHSLADIMSGRKFKSLGNVSIISHHMHSVSFRIPKATYNILYDDLCSLESDLVGAGGNVRVLNQEGEAPETTIELIAPGLPIFRVYRSRVEQLLRGEVVHKDGATVWDDFFLYPTCHRFLGFLRHQQPSVLLQRDKHHRLIKLFGPSAGRKVIADYIIAKVEHLQGQSRHTFPLSGRLIGLFFSSDLRRLQHALGQENVNLDRVRKVLHVRGGSTAYGLARDIIDHAERRYPLRMRTEKTSCSVCFGPTENAVVLACGHRYCRSCVHGYLTSASVQSWPLTCLGDDAKCQREIPLRLMQQLLNPREFEDATRRSFLAYIRSHPDELQFCPTPDCPEVYRPGPKNTTRQCPTCLNRICTYCRTECHDNMRCEERAQHQEPLFKEWVAAHDVKPCPRCSAHIERVAGCNHITCAACRTHICWVCLKTFPDDREIYGHMREAHGGIGLEEM
ncbi:hypothetical protein PUNSTDRAFT_143530 [Punctularia strigosozonata HHB-11173 SS5]|uniref:uncharacterized protein n=1 Tax=Punctularia strigosozonata (strain HHB-11173) TaxID=741275 RepID=UPI0004417589|nr:uncharacterized protein PUNSTDRAFT_143530 [Punctularia strigosozonata HHB-11173 SS5]EIN08824.1 hypothetical protein PUNSTDRAFT_143530 [Punctularia strigosozonata HHB-11173 SS5]